MMERQIFSGCNNSEMQPGENLREARTSFDLIDAETLCLIIEDQGLDIALEKIRGDRISDPDLKALWGDAVSSIELLTKLVSEQAHVVVDYSCGKTFGEEVADWGGVVFAARDREEIFEKFGDEFVRAAEAVVQTTDRLEEQLPM